jgi:hypothetical protein
LKTASSSSRSGTLLARVSLRPQMLCVVVVTDTRAFLFVHSERVSLALLLVCAKSLLR